ncbi:hypothetical protein MUP77_06135 [Candidatus Bathyarchaeota archaeon]|nr:hypothetical protein [Candidatus Bathyarchaeota archaeon]
MTNCPKCNTNTERPLKTWKIKQTPIALYECPTCKVRWRSKMTIESAVVTLAKPLETTAVGRTEVEAPVGLVSPPVVTITSAPQNHPSGIRRFFSIFGL